MKRWSIMMICLLTLTGCSMYPKQYEMLTGELDIGMGLSISPSKLIILDATELVNIPIVVENKTEKPKEITISFNKATKLLDGYEHLELDTGSYFVTHTESQVRVEKKGAIAFSLLVKERYVEALDREIWLSLRESTGEKVRQELIVRILFKGREGRSTACSRSGFEK